MPRFYSDQPFIDDPIDVDVSEFIAMCDTQDTQEIINCLIENGDIDDNYLNSFDRTRIDGTFKMSLLSLRDKWFMLSQEDEEIINKIANKYK